MNLKRPYLGLKWLTGSVFTAHLILGWVLPENNVVVDLILFNLIGIAAAAIAATLSYPISLLTGQVKVKVSIGFAQIGGFPDPVDSLRRADLVMYEAKRSGSGSLRWGSESENIG